MFGLYIDWNSFIMGAGIVALIWIISYAASVVKDMIDDSKEKKEYEILESFRKEDNRKMFAKVLRYSDGQIGKSDNPF
jgi:hypothetical protein